MNVLGEIYKTIKKKAETLSFVESCTGGGVSKKITSLSGVSDIYVGGLVPYMDLAKSGLLGVDENLIDLNTSVSTEVVLEMAKKGSALFKSDWCLATSGWAGPGGGTIDDPVGTVYFAVVGPGHESVERRTFNGSNSREVIVEQAVEYAFKFLLKALQSRT